MKTLVTGGAGFIGSHITDDLISGGNKVHILDNLSSGYEENVNENAKLLKCDIQSAKTRRIVKKGNYDVIFHHAAQIDVRKSIENPERDASVNIVGFLNLMEAACESGVEKVVFASSGGAIYGEPEYVPQDENHPERPVSPYGITKLTAEKYLNFYEEYHGLNCVALRYSNVYGPRQNAMGNAGVVAIFSRQVVKGEKPTIYGSGKQTRDYIYVDDVVRANMLAMSSDISGVFNIGTARETSVNDLFYLIRDEADSQVSEERGPAKPGEQRRSVISYQKAREELGWEPTISLRGGVGRTVEWFEERYKE